MTIMMSINGSISGTFVCGNLEIMTTMAKIIGLTMVTMVTRITKITV